jgi:hypothetical protein
MNLFWLVALFGIFVLVVGGWTWYMKFPVRKGRGNGYPMEQPPETRGVGHHPQWPVRPGDEWEEDEEGHSRR